MALVIEDGSGVSGADSYATRAEYITYVADYYGGTVEDEDASDVPLRAAFSWMKGQSWKGNKTYGRSQTGAWPRTDIEDCEGYSIDVDAIPVEVKQAQMELAWAEQQSPGTLSPSGSVRDALVSSERVDVIEVSYDTSTMSSSDALAYAQVRVEAAMRLLSCFLTGGGRVGRGTYVASV